MYFSDKVIEFYENLDFYGQLPSGISIMNPFKENIEAQIICRDFYTKFYNDLQPRRLILGINPGRLGAGATGVPFTDSHRLTEVCGIDARGIKTYEPSSVFVYEMIAAWGGPELFYEKFYFNSVCPLGFTKTTVGNKEVNFNYYDDKNLQLVMLDFIKWNIVTQIKLGCKTDRCYCLGTGKNFKFLTELNAKEGYFEKVIALEHPRYIMQYKLKELELYIKKFVEKLIP